MSLMLRAMCFICFLGAGGLGGYVGTLIATKRYPISMIERVNLTPEITPGDHILLAQHVDRHDQCDLVVKRIINTASGQRFYVKQEFEEGFGPLGGDKYVLPVPTDGAASHGEARMYSKAYSYCNWLDWIKPSESEPWELRFVFAENTKFEPPPSTFEKIGVKPNSK